MPPVVLAFIKQVPLATTAIWLLVAAEPSPVRTATNFAAIAVLVGGVFAYSRWRASSEASDRTITAQQGELEVLRSRAQRLEEALAEKDANWVAFAAEQRELRHQLKTRLAEADARTDLTGLTKLIVDNNKALADKLVGREDFKQLNEHLDRAIAALEKGT